MVEVGEVRRGFSLAGIPGWFADISADGASMSVSRLDGEENWYVDALFGPGCYPYFCHGEGDRTVLKQRLNPDSDVVSTLDRLSGLLVVNKGLQMELWGAQA